MADKKVIIYTTNICPWCIKAKEFFKEHKILYKEKNVQEDPKLANELLEKSGQMSVPVITIDDSVIIGFNKERIKKALKL